MELGLSVDLYAEELCVAGAANGEIRALSTGGSFSRGDRKREKISTHRALAG